LDPNVDLITSPVSTSEDGHGQRNSAAVASDRFYPPTSFLIQYVGTYKFNTVPNTPLEKGQVTTRGLFLLDNSFNPIETPIRFAVTGGTDAYVGASGQVTEGVLGNAHNRLLEFEV
jgi:hypothetical protein